MGKSTRHKHRRNVGKGRDPHKDEAFHTSSNTVQFVRSFLLTWMGDRKIRKDDWTFVSPTAGKGALTRGFLDKALLFDRHPCAEMGIEQKEYEELKVGELGDNIIVFENPPFGQHNAVKFFNCMANYQQVKYMTLIFPDRYRGDQTSANGKSVLNEYFHCTSYLPLPFGSFDDASGSSVQIQCSFQIWERKEYKRIHIETGFKVGKYHVTTGNIFWVKRFNPNTYTKKRKCVTPSKPTGIFKNAIPVQVCRITRSSEKKILEVVKKTWEEYPDHSVLSFHAGNIKNIINRRAISRGRLSANRG